MTNLAERVEELIRASPNPSSDYYALTIYASDGGTIEYSCFSHWVGWIDDTRRQELRAASLVRPERMHEAWRSLDEAGMIVNTADDFAIFFGYGGHALVEKALAEAVVPEWLAPHPVVNVGEYGFASPKLLPAGALNRAPTPKHRMTILKRDGYRCRVCGRSPNEHVDVELHVHHIRPWGLGGITEDTNLMTMCHTCHNGLDPHFDFSLFRLMPQEEVSDRATAYRKQLLAYQSIVARERGSDDV